MQGTALGIQAGIGNFGVSVVQFLTPWVVGFALFASGLVRLNDAEIFTAKNGLQNPIWPHNAALVWTLFILIGVGLAWVFLKSVPVRANFREQFDIFRDKHTWIMTSLYIATFGSFSGLWRYSRCSSSSSTASSTAPRTRWLLPSWGRWSARWCGWLWAASRSRRRS